MPKLELTSADIGKYGKEYGIIYKSLAELAKLRTWHTIKFKGNDLSDFFSAAITEAAIREIIADTSHVSRVRIRLLPGATYANLIRVLDSMNYTGQKKYWLDIRYQPATIYAITTKEGIEDRNRLQPL